VTPTGQFVCVQGSITAAGSTALQPLATNVANDYQGRCKGASITVNGGGSGTGLTQVAAGQVQIGNSDVFANPQQTPGLVDHWVAVVIFAIVLNSQVTGITNLTTAQLQGIYSGKTTNWNEVGGPNLPIVVVTRPASSGTRQTFQNYVLGGVETVSGPSNLQTDSTGAVLTNVRQTAGAIGYVTLGATKGQQGIKTVSIDGKEPTSANVKDNNYKFWNIEHMFTRGPATGLPQAYINYMGSDQAKQEMNKLDFVPVADMESSALATRTK
jgi:phosphate transport system substrate-binding protein